MSETVIERFNKIRWHDSKLLGLSFFRSGKDERVQVSLQLLGDGGTLTPTDLIFEGSTYLQLDVDLAGKRVCADDIAGAVCHSSSKWTLKLSQDNPHDNFDGYFHFEIGLIPPGGTINVLAKNFGLGRPADK